MKTIILLCMILFNNFNNTDVIDKYKTAYEYVRDNKIPGELFTYYLDSSIIPPYNICISDKVYYLEKQTFIDEIVDYEYNCPNGQTRRHIWDSLIHLEVINLNKNLEDFVIVPKLEEITEYTDGCDLELIFGEFDNQNRLRACLIPNRKKYGGEDYFYPQCGIDFLFYFENNEIIKVFYQNFQM